MYLGIFTKWGNGWYFSYNIGRHFNHVFSAHGRIILYMRAHFFYMYEFICVIIWHDFPKLL